MQSSMSFINKGKGMDSTHFKPINKTAALVIGRGEEYVPDKKIQTIESRVYLETMPVPKSEKGQHTFVDLTDFSYARLIVVGRYAHGSGWVARCVCGTYCVRQAKSIKNKKNTQDRCEECRQLAYAKRSHIHRTTGRDVDINEF